MRWRKCVECRKNFLAHTLTNDKPEVRRVKRCGDNHRWKIPDYHNSHEQRQRDNCCKTPIKATNQDPLSSEQSGMSGNKMQDFVILEVGPPGDTWRYNIDREKFAEKSEWFRAMLLGGLAPPASDPPPMVPLNHVDKRAFDHLLTYLRGEPLNFHSVSTARSTLDVAHELLCPELACLAVDYITANLSTSTVLGVYHGLNLYVSDEILLSDESRVPRTSAAPKRDIDKIAIACSRLLSACHNVIDASPDEVLRQENFEELSVNEVAELASRDELNLLHEGILFSALEKWAVCECRRQGLEPTSSNKRAVLYDEIWYSVRYLLMTSREFIEGPMRSGILSPDECASITHRILGHDAKNSTEQNRNLPMMSHLTTAPRNRKGNSFDNNSGMKPGKKEREDNKRNRRKECVSQGQKTCARIGDCIVRVLACVFD
ncbi:BTB/POZ domain-containing protein 6 isoform X2 [Venturia canescens]|uniref:BTB/POZ domain-containing protein 6 isoform X2 n=1 Tax=Venturia canescens TaxID=32260 RepID=UPI001C9C1CEF|nr:BTB/POZ domain-containing protein 6 isoform X2 [Venturia canescens]